MYTVDDCKLLSFAELGDDRGELIVVEGGQGKQLPFIVKRLFYIYDTKQDTVRGKHANKYSEFCFINIKGSCCIKVIDQNMQEKTFILNKPNTGLYMPKMLWKEMYGFSSDCIMLVLSNEHYNKTEYITDLQEYGGRHE